MNIVLDAITGFAKAANAILSAIPGFVWALLLALALGWGGWQKVERAGAEAAQKKAQAARDAAIGEKNQVLAQLEQQKKEAAEQLAELTAQRDAAQVKLNDAHRAQEIQDANRQAVIDGLSRKLASVQLRDPFAQAPRCGSGGPSAEGRPAAAAASGPADPAEGGGVLSDQAAQFLRGFAAEADQVNRAYAACRADAITIRGLP